MTNQDPDYTRLFIAIFLAAVVLITWQAKVEAPRRAALMQQHSEEIRKAAQSTASTPVPAQGDIAAEDNPALTRDGRIALSPRVTIASDKLHGSIALTGARFDDIKLVKYNETINKDSPQVTLLSPSGDEDAYFAQIGWLAQDGKTKVPDQHTVWQADKQTLGAGDTVTLHWNNGENVTFTLAISLDEHYMFNVAQHVDNHSGHDIAVTPYAYINRALTKDTEKKIDLRHTGTSGAAKTTSMLHEGPLGVMTGALDEVTYKELREKGNKVYDDASGWFGITDKYWLAALIPSDAHYKATFSYYSKGDKDRYQVDYLAQPQMLTEGAGSDYRVRFFAGAKEVRLLDHYAAGNAANGDPAIPLFDRAIDFGVLYFLAKPMLLLLTFFYAHSGNFGIAIMMLTIVVKLCMYPLANKSYHATSQMRELQPQMLKLRERYKEDQVSLNKEMMALYKREKVNPASGCLPVFIQMPVFFALYKVLMVSIEMRHASFVGWIRDLSAMDTSNLFTLFGLIPWEPPLYLHLGVLPMLMCATMVIQMKQQPKPADPTQAKVMSYMPYFMLIIFAKMPAGLVVYWTWSNLISIIQQRVITARHAAKKARQKLKAEAA